MKTKYAILSLIILMVTCISPTVLSISKTTHPTLPHYLPYKSYSEYIADELGWLPNNDPENMCRGTYRIPHSIEDHPDLDNKAPVSISAEGAEIFKLRGVSELKNNVVITQPGRVIYADKIFIFRNGTTKKIVKIELIGHVRIYQQHSLSISDFAMITLYPKTAEIKNTAFHYFGRTSYSGTMAGNFDAWGTAKNGRQNANKIDVMHNATYSTCSPISPAWKVSASTLILDKPNNIGKAYNAVLRIFNLPIFYYPYYSFQLNNQRKSGFLMPVLGNLGEDSQGNDIGAYVGLPYYFNLAPNYDLLTTAEYFGQRGFRASGKFRYLTKKSHGSIAASLLANDLVFQSFRQQEIATYAHAGLLYQPYIKELNSEGNQRGQLAMESYTKINKHWTSRLNLNGVSDPYYIVDTSAVHGAYLSTTNQLLNLLQFQYGSTHWEVNNTLQAYQTLHLITQIQPVNPTQNQAQALDPAMRLPDINAVGYYPISAHSDVEFDSDYTDFIYNNQFALSRSEGQRLHLRPGFLTAFESAGAYIKPQVWYDIVGYDLYNTVPGVKHTSQRALPIVDIDSGLYFSRDFTIKETSYQQTLEPRLFYLYVPYTNQNNLPNFDTIELPFFFEQLFAFNAFQGVDRQENANQLSLGLTSNIINSESGDTVLSANLGEIYFMQQPKVCLTPHCNLLNRNFSPLVAKLSFNPARTWSVNSSLAWDPQEKAVNNGNIGILYHGDDRHIFNVSYIYTGKNAGSLPTFSSFQQNAAINYSTATSYVGGYFAWPITKKWTLLNNDLYNFQRQRLESLYGGVQYDTCCWSIRFIINRIFSGTQQTTSGGLQNKFDTSYFIELTLKGLASFGTRSSSYMQQVVPGFH